MTTLKHQRQETLLISLNPERLVAAEVGREFDVDRTTVSILNLPEHPAHRGDVVVRRSRPRRGYRAILSQPRLADRLILTISIAYATGY